MVVVSIILLVVFVISALLLMAVVLIQDEQGEGLGGIFGGGSSTPFGSRSGNVLTKLTTILGAVFILTSLALAWTNRTPEGGDVIGAARRQEANSESGLDWWTTQKTDESVQTAPLVPSQSAAPTTDQNQQPSQK